MVLVQLAQRGEVRLLGRGGRVVQGGFGGGRGVRWGLFQGVGVRGAHLLQALQPQTVGVLLCTLHALDGRVVGGTAIVGLGVLLQ